MAESKQSKVSQLSQIPHVFSMIQEKGLFEYGAAKVIAEAMMAEKKGINADGQSNRESLVGTGIVNSANYDKCLSEQARLVADAAVADMAELLEAKLVENAGLLELSLGGDRGVDYSKSLTKASVLADASHSAADVARTIFILADKNRTSPNFDAFKANDALVAAAGLARYFDSRLQFEDVSVDKMVDDAFDGLKEILHTCGVSSDIAEKYISARRGDVENGLALKQAGKSVAPQL